METVTKSLVNATPRSSKFSYFDTSGTSYANNSSANVDSGGGVDVPPELYIFDSFSDFPATGEEGILYIAVAEKLLYVWNATEYDTVSANVQKIIAGNNISVSPATGTGEVTVNAADPPPPPVTGLVAGSNISLSPDTGKGDVTINADVPVKSITAGANISLAKSDGDVEINALIGVSKIFADSGLTVNHNDGEVTISVDVDAMKALLGLT
ncbi:MAG: hypothetical protein LBQ01_05980 [Prevotellaceae bacterium]|jgi:hypothetical protein|nr:hypothetical protein [Prevotellaceae bacterium]